MPETQSWDKNSIERLHQKLKAPSIFTILGIEQTYDKQVIHQAINRLKDEVNEAIGVLPRISPIPHCVSRARE